MSKHERKDRKIRELRKETRRLRLENSILRKRLGSLDTEGLLAIQGRRLFFEDTAKRASLFSKRSFSAFLIASFKLGSLFSLYKRLVLIVRRYTLITTTLKILAFILGIIQSGAIIVLFTGAAAIALPITLVFSYVLLVISFIFEKRLTKKTRAIVFGKKISVFFPPRHKALERDSYFRKMVRDAASDADSVAVIVSPYPVSPRGVSNASSFFLATRQYS